MKKWFVLILGLALVGRVLAVPVRAEEIESISATKLASVRDRCDVIREDFKALQRADSRTRVYLGRYYEIVLNKFITPLNVRLVENNLSSTSFINNQNDFNKMRSSFMIDYVEYQKKLEELITIDCRAEPEKFYRVLVEARAKRAVVEDDTEKLRAQATIHENLVKALKEKI